MRIADHGSFAAIAPELAAMNERAYKVVEIDDSVIALCDEMIVGNPIVYVVSQDEESLKVGDVVKGSFSHHPHDSLMLGFPEFTVDAH